MTALDPAAIMTAHEPNDRNDPAAWCMACADSSDWPCLPYRLAAEVAALRAEQADQQHKLTTLCTDVGGPADLTGVAAWVWLQRHILLLTSDNTTLRAREQRVRNEIDHAQFNGHVLDRDCQGVGPGEKVPAIRASHLLSALDDPTEPERTWETARWGRLPNDVPEQVQ